MRRMVIVGATSNIAEQCARLWVEKSVIDLTLIARDLSRLESIANDLKVRSPSSSLKVIRANFKDPGSIKKSIQHILKQGHVDSVLIAHGSLPDQSACQNDVLLNADTLFINGISPVLFAEIFTTEMLSYGHGNIGIISSVASDRGRKSNYSYGSAKSMISVYVEGLQHRVAGTKVKITLIKPGPTRTRMTEHLRDLKPRLANPELVAQDIVAAMDNGVKVVYSPKKWKVIMFIIRRLPDFIFNRINI
jgi:decaprenylphospho-beta-D-erythro-pentofuranosid-2-ulose 2-reductase